MKTGQRQQQSGAIYKPEFHLTAHHICRKNHECLMKQGCKEEVRISFHGQKIVISHFTARTKCVPRFTFLVFARVICLPDFLFLDR